MKSIPSIFRYDKTTRIVVNRPLHLVDWVFQGKGIATRKYDGVAILVEHGKAFIRHELLRGELMLTGFRKVQDFDPKRPQAPIIGWVPVASMNQNIIEMLALKEAWTLWLEATAALDRELATSPNPWAVIKPKAPTVPDGTYELCGPKIRGNHERLELHLLIPHGYHTVKHVPRSYDGLKKFLETFDGEGIVWHYKTGNVTQMAKIKRRDFGFYTRLSPEEVAAIQAAGKPIVEDNKKEGSGIVVPTIVATEERKGEHILQ